MKPKDLYSFPFVTGVKKRHGSGLLVWPTHGEQPKIFRVIGNLFHLLLIDKMGSKFLQEKGDGTTPICLKWETKI